VGVVAGHPLPVVGDPHAALGPHLHLHHLGLGGGGLVGIKVGLRRLGGRAVVLEVLLWSGDAPWLCGVLPHGARVHVGGSGGTHLSVHGGGKGLTQLG
jgi:hypothetical protein